MKDAARDKQGSFLTGNTASGGRPWGSRVKLSEAFLAALHADFAEHGRETIERVRVEKPDAYLKVISSILPKQIEVSTDPFDGMSDDELEALVAAASAAMKAHQEADVGEERLH